ncbi:MAG: ATP-binding cassette domain-containing protein [Ruminococcus sp.]|nr:ATP-binding cassette domain-containing protein [Ruminococcus sp.]
MAQIVFEHVTKKFGEETVLRDISFEIEQGEFVFVIGKSGAGKSTLLNLIMKQEEVSSGKITVNGRRVDNMRRQRIPLHRRKLGVVSPEVGLLKDRTVYDNILFAMLATEQKERHRDKNIMRVLGLVGLAEKFRSYPEELSGGEQARVLLARALSVQPEILIADEPTANLDPDASWDLMQLLGELNYRGMTILMASHARELVTIMKKRCLTLVAGTLVADERRAIYNTKATDIFEERRIRSEGGKKEEKTLYLLKNIR